MGCGMKTRFTRTNAEMDAPMPVLSVRQKFGVFAGTMLATGAVLLGMAVAGNNQANPHQDMSRLTEKTDTVSTGTKASAYRPG